MGFNKNDQTTDQELE